MSDINVSIEGGKSKRLLTAGKYCPADIVVSADGSAARDPDLPAGYWRVDYILFNGNQITDSGIVCNQDTKIHVLFTRESTGSTYLYGVISDGNTASMTAYLSTNGSWRFGNKYVSRPISTDAELIRNVIVTKSGVKHETGTATLSGVSDFETPGTLPIGGARQASGVLDAQFVGKMLIFEMWQGEEQVRKLVPLTNGTVYRFYDKVSNAFFDSLTDTPFEGGNL